MKFEWEKILEMGVPTTKTITLRAKIFGGWLVKDVFYEENIDSRCMVFVPDPEHKWEVTL